MRLTIEGQELIQAIRRGLDFDVPAYAEVNIVAGRGANEDRAEIEWALDAAPVAECPFEPDPEPEEDEVDPDQTALPLDTDDTPPEQEPESEEKDKDDLFA